MERPFLLVIAGPTASGKSALAVDLAERWNAEIVGADSQQVYAGFDVGTAKPPPDVLARVPHHLISVVQPGAQFSAAAYQQQADDAISDIDRRGKRAIVVGGTGLYIRALLRGIMPAPAAQPELRAALLEEARVHGLGVLHERLARVDPESAARISVNDAVRIVRALELAETSGTKASVQRAAHAFAEARYPHALFVLSPPREAVVQAIEARTQAMFAAGLLEETEKLLSAGHRDTAPMRSIGYRQAVKVLAGEMTEAQAIADVARQTRQYAKRQMTWFRREPGARFVTPPYDALMTQSAALVADGSRF
ncbi:MAG: tRNA (adenosine(37)-N6)-dimethylallyltransferase MiaA [Myxococcaceae bacterium]